jgi:uncharacterized integral membrane protein
MAEANERGQYTGAGQERSTAEIIRLALAVAAVAVLVLFFFSNLQSAEIRFLWWEWQTRVIWALLISAGVGALAGLLVPALQRRRHRDV